MKTQMNQGEELENLLDERDVAPLMGPEDDDEGNDLIFDDDDDDFDLDDFDDLGDFDDDDF